MLNTLKMVWHTRALKSTDPQACKAAIEALSELHDVSIIEQLIQLSEKGDEEVRLAAIKGLGRLGDTGVVEPLFKLFGDENVNIRGAAIEALGRIGAPSVEPLIARLGSADNRVRSAAIGALGKIGAPAVEPLFVRLDSDDKNFRSAVICALGEIGDARAVKPLIAQLGETHRHICEAAIAALGKIGAPAVKLLTARLGNEDMRVRSIAIRALGETGDACAVEPLIAQLGDTHQSVCEAALEALTKIGADKMTPVQRAVYFVHLNKPELAAQCGAPAVGPLIAQLGDTHQSVCEAAIAALGKIGEPAVEPLIARLGDEDKRVRSAAVRALGEIGDVRAVAPLIAGLGDLYQSVCEAALEALTKIGADKMTAAQRAVYFVHINEPESAVQLGAPAVDALIAQLKDRGCRTQWSENGWAVDTSCVPNAALEALTKIGADKMTVAQRAAYFMHTDTPESAAQLGAPAVESLIAQLGDKNADVRSRAVEALTLIGQPAVEPLIAWLGESVDSVSSAAIEALGKLGDKRAAEPLIKALENADSQVRLAAVEGLGKLGDLRAVDPIIVEALADIGGDDLRKAAADALCLLGQPQWSQWVKGDSEDFVRLGSSGEPRVVEPLVHALGNIDWQICRAAAMGLCQLSQPQWTQWVNVVKEEAARLGSGGEPSVVAPLIYALGHNDWQVRKAAAMALGQLGQPQWTQWVKGDDEDFTRLGSSGELRVVEPLIHALQNNYSQARKAAAAGALCQAGQSQWAHWVNGVNADFSQLGTTCSEPPVVEPLVDALGNKDRQVRKAAAIALCQLGQSQRVTGDNLKLAFEGRADSNPQEECDPRPDSSGGEQEKQ